LDIKTTTKKDSKVFKILHIGTSANKNLTNVIRSLSNINCTLIIVGKILPKDSDLLEKHHIDFKNYINISNKKIISLYQDANLLTFPSFHEGFGLPIIEAQMAGTPVITSKISPMKEVSGNAAHLVDPNSVSDIRNGILKIIDSSALQNKMREEGLKNTERYSVKIVTVKHIELYRKTLEKFI
jgi:glycosyltransferase involved in cell wall biosynthesis